MGVKATAPARSAPDALLIADTVVCLTTSSEDVTE
jgi:hypothetical protein